MFSNDYNVHFFNKYASFLKLNKRPLKNMEQKFKKKLRSIIIRIETVCKALDSLECLLK